MTEPTVIIKMPGSDAPVVTAPIPGWRTTEFWTTVASLVGAGAGVLPPKYAALVVAVYIAVRGGIKIAHTLGLGAAIPEPPPLPGQTSTTITTTQGTAP